MPGKLEKCGKITNGQVSESPKEENVRRVGVVWNVFSLSTFFYVGVANFNRSTGYRSTINIPIEIKKNFDKFFSLATLDTHRDNNKNQNFFINQ